MHFFTMIMVIDLSAVQFGLKSIMGDALYV